jgi:hypothetical protein
VKPKKSFIGAIFLQEFERWCEENNIEVSNRYSQWLSTRQQDGVYVPRMLWEMEHLKHDLYEPVSIECMGKGKFCYLMHERALRALYTQGDPSQRFFCQ